MNCLGFFFSSERGTYFEQMKFWYLPAELQLWKAGLPILPFNHEEVDRI